MGEGEDSLGVPADDRIGRLNDFAFESGSPGAADRRGAERGYYGAKYPNKSSTSWVGLDANALIWPLIVGTIAMFDVMVASREFNVDTVGVTPPCGHRVR